jgi:hypothetical protein
MAKATRTMEVLAVEGVPTKIVLTLSVDEATTLAAVAGAVGGPPSGRRGHMGAMLSALHDAGISALSNDPDIDGCITLDQRC